MARREFGFGPKMEVFCTTFYRLDSTTSAPLADVLARQFAGDTFVDRSVSYWSTHDRVPEGALVEGFVAAKVAMDRLSAVRSERLGAALSRTKERYNVLFDFGGRPSDDDAPTVVVSYDLS